MSPYISRDLYHLPSVQITSIAEKMTSYIENNLPLLHFSIFVTTEIAFIVGLMTHIFIIAVCVTDWRKGRTMSTSDQVIISLMISKMILQSLIQLKLFWKLFCRMCSPIYYLVMGFISTSALYSTFWLSTLLGVVFYLKISNIHSVFFLQMKSLFSKRILYFIMASLLVCIGQTLMIYLVKDVSIFSNSTNDYVDQREYAKYAVWFGNMFGLLLIRLLSSLFLITSLYLHIKRMRCNRNVTGSLDPYYRIIKYITGSFFTSVLCIIICVVVERFIAIFGVVAYAFPWITFETLQSMLLIYATPKLKDPFSRILKYLSNCGIKREETGDLVMTDTT